MRSVTLRDVRVDVMTFPGPLQDMSAVARDVEAAGFDGVLFTEGGRTAYLSAAVTSISRKPWMRPLEGARHDAAAILRRLRTRLPPASVTCAFVTSFGTAA